MAVKYDVTDERNVQQSLPAGDGLSKEVGETVVAMGGYGGTVTVIAFEEELSQAQLRTLEQEVGPAQKQPGSGD